MCDQHKLLQILGFSCYDTAFVTQVIVFLDKCLSSFNLKLFNPLFYTFLLIAVIKYKNSKGEYLLI